MTYVVRIWEPPSNRPLPDSIDTADRLVDELDACRPSGENPKFVALAQRLTQRFPTADMWPVGDEDEEDEVPQDAIAWKDWSISDKIDDAVWNLGLNVDMLVRVRPFLVQEANGLGLCMTDDQAGEVFLPDGRVLRVTEPEPVQRGDPSIRSRTELKPAKIPSDAPYRLHLLRATMVTVRDAERELSWARQRKGEDSSKFQRRWFEAVAKMLNQDQKDVTPLPWFSGQPLEVKFDGDVMIVEVRADCVAEIRPRVLLAAAWQGLAVYDPHAQQAFWPSGAFVVADSLYEPWRKGNNECPEYPVYRAAEILRAVMPPLLEPLGFACTEDCDGWLRFERGFTGGSQRLDLSVNRSYPGSAIEVRIEIEMTPEVPRGSGIPWPQRADGTPLRLRIYTYLAKFFAPDETFGWFLDYDPKYNYRNQNSIAVYVDAHTKSAGKLIVRKFIDHALPVFRNCETVAGLNGTINAQLPRAGLTEPGPFLDVHWSPYHLILAHLADDPRFDDMCAEVLARYGHVWKAGGHPPEQHGLPPSQFAAIQEARRLARAAGTKP